MFLVNDRSHGETILVFTFEDPREDGYSGDVLEGVDLEYEMNRVHRWHEGEPALEVCVGRDKADPMHYRVFRHTSELEAAGYELMAGTAIVLGTWTDYVRVRLNPPDPLETDEELYLKYLDRLDEDARRRRQHAASPPAPKNGNRDEIAAWVANNHLLVDTSIREIRYLPQGAPGGEIRLLELSDRFPGNGNQVEAIKFGLDVEGAPFLLAIADVTSEQLEQIKQDSSRLPSGWSLEGSRVWRRGA